MRGAAAAAPADPRVQTPLLSFSRARLKNRRFQKVYEYLRQELGSRGLVQATREGLVPLEADMRPLLTDQASSVLEELDPEVRRDVEVVLQLASQQLQHPDGEIPLDQPTFCHFMDQVVQGPRDYLQPGTGKPRADHEAFTFQPQINRDEESRRMAARRRPSHVKIYEILQAENQTRQEKIQALKQHIEQERVRECSFKPETNKGYVASSRVMQRLAGGPGTGAAPAVGGGGGGRGAAVDASAYDDLEREVRMILEKHSGGGRLAAGQQRPSSSQQAQQQADEEMVEALHRLIGQGGSPGSAGKAGSTGPGSSTKKAAAGRKLPWEDNSEDETGACPACSGGVDTPSLIHSLLHLQRRTTPSCLNTWATRRGRGPANEMCESKPCNFLETPGSRAPAYFEHA